MDKLSESILLLVDIASNIRERRLAKGGLELESVEVSVQFANPETRTGKLEDLIPKEVFKKKLKHYIILHICTLDVS